MPLGSLLVGHLGAEVLQSDLLRPDLNSDELMMSIAWIGCQIEVLRRRCLVEEVYPIFVTSTVAVIGILFALNLKRTRRL